MLDFHNLISKSGTITAITKYSFIFIMPVKEVLNILRENL